MLVNYSVIDLDLVSLVDILSFIILTFRLIILFFYCLVDNHVLLAIELNLYFFYY